MFKFLMTFLEVLLPVQNCHSQKDKTKVLMTNGSLMKVKSIEECSPCFVYLFLSGRFTQVLLYYWSYTVLALISFFLFCDSFVDLKDEKY